MGDWSLEDDPMTNSLKADVNQETLQLSSLIETSMEIGHNSTHSKSDGFHHLTRTKD
jgi:hypothetical protein